jgi:thiamine transport system ATP-binding protein
MLEIRDLQVGYDARVAVRDLDLTVGDREVVAVLGPSGSGKTTLLRAIAGLEQPTAGSIVRDGRDLAGVQPHQRGLGLMFQDHALFPHRDVVGNVMFGLRMQGVPRPTARERAGEVLAVVGLAGSEERKVHELSGGEQQRVALARALAPAPSLLMLDEPLGALDRALRETLAHELRELFVRLELSVLLVTHDHDEAFEIGDRVAVMHDGRIEQIGRPEAVWARPATEFVARFLGWNVTASLGDGRSAVRPDALLVEPSGPLEGTVVGRTFRRDHFRLRVALTGTGEQLLVELRTPTVPEVGDRVHLSADPGGVVALPSPP